MLSKGANVERERAGVIPKLTIVIVDARGANLPVYRRLVAEFPGSHIMCFADLQAAEHACATHTPDIFMIDDDTPSVVPAMLNPNFREHPPLRDALIVLMSSRESPLQDQSRRSGADVFLPKPVDTKFFMAMLHQAVRLHNARADIASQRQLA